MLVSILDKKAEFKMGTCMENSVSPKLVVCHTNLFT